MTTKQFHALETTLLPALPGFVVKGRLMLLPPVRHMLRALSFEGSGFSKVSFYVNVFVMPLTVPHQYVAHSHGDRVRHRNGADGWEADDPAEMAELPMVLRDQALPFLLRIKTPLDFVADVRAEEARIGRPLSGNTLEDVAYMLALAGQTAEAVRTIEQLLACLKPSSDWQFAMVSRLTLIREKLLADPAEAREQLEAWEAETVRNLGLEEFRSTASGDQ